MKRRELIGGLPLLAGLAALPRRGLAAIETAPAHPLVLDDATPADIPFDPGVDTSAPLSEDLDADVVIVGSGAAGLCAAIAARTSGAGRVMILEKASIAGGHTILSSGSFAAARRPEDVTGLMNEMLDASRGAAVPELVRVVAEGSWAAKERLSRLGVTWVSEPFRAVGGLSARCWNTGSPQSGYDYVQALMRGARRLGVDIRLGVTAESLLTEPLAVEPSTPRLRVTGLTARVRGGGRLRIRAGAVILATGGFTANKALIYRYTTGLPISMPTTANPRGDLIDGSTGEGILMASAIGAKLRDMDAVQVIPFNGGRLIDYVGAEIWLNGEGRRFISEGEDFLELRTLVELQPGGVMWAVSDAKSPKGATLGLKLMEGIVSEARSVEELARGMSVPARRLRETLEKYNRSVKSGWDEEFGRPMRAMTIDTPPFFYGREIFALHYSCGGIAITARAEVIDGEERPVPGLYAAGETTGGVHGKVRVGGCGLVDAMVFGDVAGREAAAFAAAAGSSLSAASGR